MKKINSSVLFGILCFVVFVALLGIRMDLFRKKDAPAPLPSSVSFKPQSSWMNIYQNNKKIGFLHRSLSRDGNGLHFKEKVFLQINTMGSVQDVNIDTDGRLNPDMTLSSFNFLLNSGIFRFHAQGRVIDKKLVLLTGSESASQRSEIPLRNLPQMSGSIYEAAFQSNMEENTTRSFSMFDPSSLSLREIKITRQGDENIFIMGEKIAAKKYCIDFMGAENCAWLDANGDVLRESGLLGLSMEKVSQQEAATGIGQGADIDFTKLASIPSNVPLKDADLLKQIKYRISGVGRHLFLDGGRQSFHDGILSVTKEIIPDLGRGKILVPASVAPFLKAEPLIQSDDALIRQQAAQIVNPGDPPQQKARKIVTWVYTHVEKKPSLSVPNALEVLKNKTGDCNEHAVLTAALLRASGIPTQVESGLVYLNGRFYYHAWCVLYLNEWITADAVFNQFPADVTHIRLVRGGSAEQLNLMGVMGKLKLEVIEQKK